MKRETMLSSKHTATTPRTSAAETITSLAGKRNRSSNNLDLCTIDNEAFLLNDLGMPNLEASEVAARHRKACSDTKGQQQQTIVLPPLQQVGVFGVDANKRINLWNDAAAAVTGVFSPKNRCIHQHSEPEDDDSSDYGNDEDIHGRAIGMSLDDVFPSSSFEIDTGRTPPSVSTSITLADVLDRVFQTGEPSMAVPVIQKAGRKRGREEMTDESSFSVDFLPQFGFSPMVSSRMVSGVVLVCRSEKAIQRLLSREDDRSLIDIARSITMPPPLDKDRSMSAASTGTFTTETCTTGTCMTETETEVDIDKEIEAEIDNSFHTCQIDTSFRTNQIDGSFQSCQIDPSHSTPHGTKSERLEALEAFEAFEASDNSTDGDNDELHRSLLSPPLATRKASSITDEDHRMLFETVDSIIFGVDLAGKIDAWNYRMEELTGLSRDDAMGRSLVEDTSLPLLPFNLKKPGALTFRGEVEPVLSKAYRGRSTPQFRLKVKSKTSGRAPNEESLSGQSDESRGILRHLVASVSPRYNHQKEIIGAFFLATDLTEGFMYFQSLKTDAHELRKLIDTANAPIFGINANGYV
jgi:PAS domain-containing protein